MVKKKKISPKISFDLMRGWANKVHSIYAHAKKFYLTEQDIYSAINIQIYSDPNWRLVQKHYRYYIDGMLESKRKEVNSNLVFLMYIDGTLLTAESINALTQAESALAARINNYVSPWSRVDMKNSRHVWKDSLGNPISEMSFDEKFRVIDVKSDIDKTN